MKALEGFYRDEKGMVPYSLLGITMLLIVGVAIYHFNNVDILKAQERNSLNFDMETFYATTKIGQDIQQVARISTENTVLDHSMSTYGNPIDVNKEWDTKTSFEDWKNKLEKNISEEAKKRIYDFYHGGNQNALEKQYYNPSTNFDFSNFLLRKGDIEVSMTQDSYDSSAKIQRPIELNVGFEDGGVVSAKNRFTGYELSMPAGTVVSVNSRPFTMADKAYDFTQTFNSRDSADELAWYLWGVQEVLGLLEATGKHNVKFATDDRVSYSIMHLIVAYKELEHFGTFDYVHTTLEFLRPWMGSEGEANEFLTLFEKSIEGGYVDQAIESMDAAIFIRNVASRVQSISDSMIKASSYLDSETATEAGGGFESSEVEGLQLSGEGTMQHLERAEDTQKLTEVYDEIANKKITVFFAKTDVKDNSIISLSVESQFKPLEDEWSEVRGEWKNAKSDFTVSQRAITRAKDDYSALYSYIDGEKCKNPIAAMLWFGDSSQSVKGFREILSSKINETGEFVDYYRDLEQGLNALEYTADEYEIDAHYNKANDALEMAEANFKKARDARGEYDYWINKYGKCHSYGCSTGKGDPLDCYSKEVEECIVEVDWDEYECFCVSTEEGGNTCDTCYRASYECTCKEEYWANAKNAEDVYKDRMELAEQNLDTAASEVSTLQTQIDAFFTENGLSNVYSAITVVPYSISDGYYSHWNYSSCPGDNTPPGRRYECAKMLVPDPPSHIDETNYGSNMPKSPLTYNAASKDYNNYGLYYIKYVADKMDETFSDESINVEAMKRGKDTLEKMKNTGFFKKILSILKPVKKLIDMSGDVKSAIATIKNADEKFPNINEHFYTTLPMPPVNGSKIGFEYQGFTVIHDIRLRANTHPGDITVPIIKKKVSLGKDDAVNPALPIPYTPISVYLWGFDIGPSKVGNKKDGASEPSTLWLIDTENTQIAPLMEMKTDSDGNVPVPLYLHKPIMYKYEFTPKETISKGLDRLPPVFVLSLGPFKTRFQNHMEPPDKKITDNPLPIDVTFDKEFTNDSTILTISTQEGITVKKYITEVVNGNSHSLPEEKREIYKKDLKLLGEYGWSEIKADAYATDGPKSDLDAGDYKGEDHARVYFIDDSLISIGIKLEKKGPKLNVLNTGNKKVDVAISARPDGGCAFILSDGGMAKNWIGSVGTDAPVALEIISEGNIKMTANVLMPEKIKDKLKEDSISLTLKDET